MLRFVEEENEVMKHLDKALMGKQNDLGTWDEILRQHTASNLIRKQVQSDIENEIHILSQRIFTTISHKQQKSLLTDNVKNGELEAQIKAALSNHNNILSQLDIELETIERESHSKDIVEKNSIQPPSLDPIDLTHEESFELHHFFDPELKRRFELALER
jgi:hypothetical protein